MRFLRPRGEPEVGIIVVAAGSGSRLGHPDPKAFVAVAGRPILWHALEGVFGSAEPAQVVVVAPAEWIETARLLSSEVAGAAHESVTVVVGSDSRQGSVAAGLAALAPGWDTTRHGRSLRLPSSTRWSRPCGRPERASSLASRLPTRSSGWMMGSQ
jgi:hypothetical protein